MRPTAILFITALLLAPCVAEAQVTPWISYQGVLKDPSGDFVPDGIYSVTFAIYDVDTGGSALWTEPQTVLATDGVINAWLGSVAPFTGVFFDVVYWLGISVEGEPELSPRTLLTSVPYAFHASYADVSLTGDSDWGINGDNVYVDYGNVGIGTVAPAVRLDVMSADQPCARFENASPGNGVTIRAANGAGTAGAFFSGVPPSVFPDVPCAVFGIGGPGYRAAHFESSTGDAVFSFATTGAGIWANSTEGYAGYFGGGGLGVYVQGQLETEAFRMFPGAASGYVLTSDGGGLGTWQPAGTGGDSDWTISGSDMYSGVTGSVGIGESSPTAKLEVYSGGRESVAMCCD